MRKLLLNLLAAGGALAISTSCGSSPTSPSERTGYAGEWVGSTLQGSPISFSVSSDQKVTRITFAYNLNGCSGSRAFDGLSLDIGPPNRLPNRQPNSPPVTGPFANPGFGYASGATAERDFVSISGAFQSFDTALGVIVFSEYFGCGNGAAAWNARRN